MFGMDPHLRMVHGVVEEVHLRREPIPVVDELGVLEGQAVADPHHLTVHGERLEIEVGGVEDGPAFEEEEEGGEERGRTEENREGGRRGKRVGEKKKEEKRGRKRVDIGVRNGDRMVFRLCISPWFKLTAPRL